MKIMSDKFVLMNIQFPLFSIGKYFGLLNNRDFLLPRVTVLLIKIAFARDHDMHRYKRPRKVLLLVKSLICQPAMRCIYACSYIFSLHIAVF